MSRQTGLGRGLGSLIPTEPRQPDGEPTFQEVAIGLIRANPYQPRTAFDQEALESLARSIAELGVLQPLLVRREADHFALIAGERRLRAAQLAGLVRVPVVLRHGDDKARLEEALVENLHRQDLNALEEAAAYHQLADDFGLSQAAIATRVGRSRSAVANTMRLLGLPQTVQMLLIEGSLTAGHARALLALDDEQTQISLAERIVREQLTVRDVEQAIRDGVSSPTKQPAKKPGSNRDAAVLELERLLSDRLDTTVRVKIGAKRGQIVVEYADLDDLERIYHVIAG